MISDFELFRDYEILRLYPLLLAHRNSKLNSQYRFDNIRNCYFINNSYFWLKCRCNEDIVLLKDPKSDNRTRGKAFVYPKKRSYKTFEIKYSNKLSTKAKFILNSFNNKYIYYAIDDLLYLLKSNPTEKENLLTVLYSSILALHNNLEINFFDIWIDNIYINEIGKNNRFFKVEEQSQTLTHITLTLFYRTRSPFKKPEAQW